MDATTVIVRAWKGARTQVDSSCVLFPRFFPRSSFHVRVSCVVPRRSPHMTVSLRALKDRFEGCLFGLAVGDALGGKFEAQTADAIRARFPTVASLFAYPQEEIWYTDDTQMAVGVSEALIESGEIVEEVLCRAFLANYLPSRGYGRGARAVLEAMEDGRDYRQVAEQHFPGGSFGNGAAMRVAPIGLVFRDNRQRLWDQARLSALPTHLHPLGIEGAQLLALAVGLCSKMDRFDHVS